MANKYIESSIVNRGNWARLKACMKRAAAGEKLTIGYLGGSITMGSVATVQEKCYAYLSHMWWKETFPQAEIQFVNAGIGATTSQFGVARVEEDLLRYEPDVVFIEFTVNDDSTPHFQETYEGLVRRVYGSKLAPAVVTLQNAFYHDGVCAEEIHTPVAKFYELPCVSFKKSVVARVMEGVIVEEDITPDHLHPNDKGHALLAETVKYFLEQVYAEVDVEEESYVLTDKTLTKNRYVDAKRLRNNNLELIDSTGFVADTDKQHHITDIFKNGWEATAEGSFMEFEVDAECIAIQYRRTIKHPAPSMKVIVDGEEKAILNGEFDETWGDLIALETVLEQEGRTLHNVRLEIMNVHDNDKLPFYLVSVQIA